MCAVYITLKRRQMQLSPQDLAQEAARATEILHGKVVARIARHRDTEVLVEFTDGTRLFVDRSESAVELSITGGASD
jgi:hypothetical protein